jgi:hypothetical protein
MSCRDEKIDGKIIQRGRRYHDHITNANALILYHTLYIYHACVIPWTQGKDESDPDKRIVFLVIHQHI